MSDQSPFMCDLLFTQKKTLVLVRSAVIKQEIFWVTKKGQKISSLAIPRACVIIEIEKIALEILSVQSIMLKASNRAQ